MHAALHFSAKTTDLHAFSGAARTYDPGMPHTELPVFILGAGRLAAAVRVHLRSTSNARASLHRDTFDGTAALLVACSDFERDPARHPLDGRWRMAHRFCSLLSPMERCEQGRSYLLSTCAILSRLI